MNPHPTLRPAPMRVPAEGAQPPEAFSKDKTGTGLKPVYDAAGNVTGYMEVQDSRPVGVTPKYLIGIGPAQGIVKPYNSVLAKNPNYRPSNTLPASHIKSAKQAAIRDSEEIEAKKRYAEQLKRDRIAEQTQEAITLDQRRQALLAQPEVQDLSQQLEDGYHQIAAVENTEELQEFCDANEIPIHLDAGEDLESLRAIIRGMFQQHIETVLRKQQGLDQEEQDGAEVGIYERALVLVRKEKKATVPMLKQKLEIEYNAAVELINKLEQNGVITAKDSTGKRKVL